MGHEGVHQPAGPEQHDDDDEVVEHGREHRCREPSTGIEHRGRDRDEPVDADLGGEHSQQLRCDRTLEPVTRSAKEHPDDGWCRGNDDQDSPQQDHCREAHDGVDAVVGVLVVPAEQADEDRNEDRGQDAAGDELVDHVRRVIGRRICVGEGRHAEPEEGDRAHCARDAGQEGSRRHDGGGPAKSGVGALGVGALGVGARHERALVFEGWLPAAFLRCDRRMERVHHMARKVSAPIVSTLPSAPTRVERRV